MRGFLVLLVAGLVGVSSAQSVEAWRERFASYDHHSPKWQREIILSIPEFSRAYRPLIENLPEYKECGRQVQDVLDRLEKVPDKRTDPKQWEASKAEIGKLRREIDTIYRDYRGKHLRVVQGLLDGVDQVLRKGLASDDKGVRAAALSTLLGEIGAYRAVRPAYELCGTGRTDHGEMWRDTISKLVLEEAKARPAGLLDYVRSKKENYRDLALILSDARIPGIRDLVIGFLSSGSDEDVFSGCECVTAWPQPQYLPYVTARLKTIESSPETSEQYGLENVLGYAIRSYGSRGSEAILQVWNTLPAAAKQVALDQCFKLPCKATLNLYYRGLEDPSPEVRSDAESVLDLFDREWDGYYSGRNPRDLTPADKAEAKSRLARMNDDLDHAGWRELFASYDGASREGQIRVLAAIPLFSQRFEGIARTISGYPSDEEYVQWTLDLKDKPASLKTFEEASDSLVDGMVETLRKGLASDDIPVRNAAFETLFEVAGKRFKPRKAPYVVCGAIGYRGCEHLAYAISNLVRETALKDRQVFIAAARGGDRFAAISLAEGKAEEAVLVKLFESDKNFETALECAIAWHALAFLPKLLDRFARLNPEGEGKAYTICVNALLGYGGEGAVAIEAAWSKLPASGKPNVLQVLGDLRCRASLNTALRALDEPKLRLQGIEVISSFLGEPLLRNEYTGPCPDDISEQDQKRAEDRLTQCLADPDPKIAQAARKALARLAPLPSATSELRVRN